MSTNPFNIAYEGLIKSFFKVPALRAAIREGNRITFSGANAYPISKNVADGDLPELMLFQGSMGGTLNINADSCKIILSYTLNLSTGSYNSDFVNDLLFGCVAALLNWKRTLHTLQFNGQPFIQNVRMNPTPIGLSNEELNRKIPGWSAIMGIELDLYLQTQTILTHLNVES